MTAAQHPILSVENLSVDFLTDRGWARVVEDVSFSVAPGETLGLVGESGSGKTVTSLSIMQLVPMPPGRFGGGRIVFDGQDLTQLPRSSCAACAAMTSPWCSRNR
jgi:peptide/nickel transport system ATP-binding protein